MINNPAQEKSTCYLPLMERNCPDICLGLLASELILGHGEGCIVQVCPNPMRLDQPTVEPDCSGLGPDVIILHRDTIPSVSEYRQAVDQFGQ